MPKPLTDDRTSLSPWMENLPFVWHPLVDRGQTVTLNKHEHLFWQGQPAAHVFIVLHGRIRLYVTSPAGDEKAIAIVGKNGLIGECGMFDRPYSTSAITASKAAVVKLPISIFDEELKRDYRLARQVLSFLDRKNRILASQAMQLGFFSAVQRIGYTLCQLAQTYGRNVGGACVIDIRFTHQELANLVGTSRVTVANTMRALENNGMISKRNGKYVIKDVELLLRHVCGEGAV